jgi:hypothetical protein
LPINIKATEINENKNSSEKYRNYLVRSCGINFEGNLFHCFFFGRGQSRIYGLRRLFAQFQVSEENVHLESRNSLKFCRNGNSDK